MKKISVLYVHTSSYIGGGNQMFLQLFEQLRNSEFQPISILPGKGPMESQLSKQQIPYVIIPLNQFLTGRKVTVIWTILLLVKLFWQCKVRLLHTLNSGYYRYIAIAAKISHIPIVYHLQLPTDKTSLKWEFQYPPKIVISCSQILSEQFKGILKELGIITKVVTVRNAIDVNNIKSPSESDVIKIRRSLQIEHFSHIITIVGLVSERKGHRYFLEMAKEVLLIFSYAGFMVVGEDILGNGEYRREMENYARELGISRNILFTGFREDANEWIAASDLIVLPSLQEGLPISLVEAHACGKPAVATSVDGIPEIVEDGVTGILVPPKDVNALTQAVLKLMNDQSLSKKMGMAGRNKVESFFDISEYSKKIIQIYSSLLGMKS